MRKAKVAAGVVELPHILGELVPRRIFPRRAVDRAGEPAVVIDRAVAGDLEILCEMPVLGLRIVERIHHAHALNRSLWRAVDGLRLRQMSGFKYCRRDVDHVMPLRPDLVFGVNSFGPVDNETVARAAIARGDLLRPSERRVAGDRPTSRVVRIGIRAAEIVEVLENLGHALGNFVEVSALVEKADHPALGGGAVVANDVEH